VNDFVKDIDRRREKIQRALDYVDGSNNAGAETARLCQHYFLNGHQLILPVPLVRKMVRWRCEPNQIIATGIPWLKTERCLGNLNVDKTLNISRYGDKLKFVNIQMKTPPGMAAS